MYFSAKAKIKAIHHAIDTASENALKQAREIIETCHISNEQENLALRLQRIGFTSNPIIKEITSKNNILQISKAEANIILDYQINYPTLKFLRIEQLEHICNKYGLIYAPVNHFIGDIPEKNLIEIENAPNIKDSHACPVRITAFVSEFGFGAKRNFKKFWNKGVDISNIHADWYSISNGFFSEPFFKFLREVECPGVNGSYNERTTYIKEFSIQKKDMSGLYIAGPREQFNVKKTIKSLLSISIISIKRDPIVFRYCKDGILVITKWGLEGNDPVLTNEIQN